MFGNKALDGFNYKGFKYTYDLQQEDDNCKTLHECVLPDGKTMHMPWSPYSNPTEADFKLWIDLGCPEGIRGNLDGEDLEYIRDNKLATFIFDLKSRSSDWSRQAVRVTAASKLRVCEIAASTWPTCEVLNLRQDNMVEQFMELQAIESAIGGE
jgi:hypothetical protein